MIASLRTRLLVGTVGGTVLLLTVFSFIIYTTVRRALLEEFDGALESTAHLFAASVEHEENEVELGFDLQQMPEFRDPHNPTFYQLWGANDTVMAKSPLLHADSLRQIADGVGSPVFANSRGSDGRPQRAVGLRFIPRASDNQEGPPPPRNMKTLSLTMARDATELYGQLAFLRRLLCGASVAVAALSVLVAAVIVRHGLAPLNLIAAQIAAVKADDLTARVDAQNIPKEIVPVRDRLNDLLSRLEASFERERRFTADVAHELRTPLAGMRSTLEVTLSRARDCGEYQTVLSDCLEIAQSMQAMMNNLLMLARLDAHQVTLRQDQVQLADLLDACWQPFAESASQRRIVFESTLPEDLTCISDPDSLSMVLSNLLANAAEYTDEGGRIWVAGHRTDQRTELTLSNTGCSLTDEQLSQIFDRFWRGDSARTDAGVHCGLGLALVHRLISTSGGSVVVERQAGGVFAVRLTLPDTGQTGS